MRLAVRARQRPVLLPESKDPRRGKLGDREITTHREIDDRRGHVLGVRALVDEQARLRRPDLVRWLVLRDDRLVLAVVAPGGPPVPRDESESAEHGEERSAHGPWCRLEVIPDLAIGAL